MQESKRHHYVPQFLIKQFSNEDNLVFVYDKVNDRIVKTPRSTKSIFFEYHRNTIKIDGQTNDLIEQLYSSIDNDIAFLLSKNITLIKIIKQYLILLKVVLLYKFSLIL